MSEQVPTTPSTNEAARTVDQMSRDYFEVSDFADATKVPYAKIDGSDRYSHNDFLISQSPDAEEHGVRRGTVSVLPGDNYRYPSPNAHPINVTNGVETSRDKIGRGPGAVSPVKVQAKELTGIYTAVSGKYKGYEGNYPTYEPFVDVTVERPTSQGDMYRGVLKGKNAEKAATLISKRAANRISQKIEKRAEVNDKVDELQG